MKFNLFPVGGNASGRSPHGERGLKLEWAAKELCGDRRSPHGERGLKFDEPMAELQVTGGRSPHGERGLKFWLPGRFHIPIVVAPHTGSVD